MSGWPGPDFLLTTRVARALYHEHAAALPIVDYHSHLDPASVADDRRFDDVADLWVCSDPYKWRAMRMNGVAERAITGDASRQDKFRAWAATVPFTVGNPLFHWTALELERYFGVDELLQPGTAEALWRRCNERLGEPAFSALGLLRRSNVECFCTSDDLVDPLDHHRRFLARGEALAMLPSLRADALLAVDAPAFPAYCRSLAAPGGPAVEALDSLQAAVRQRLDAFDELGCRVADHGLDQLTFDPVGDNEAARLLDRRLRGESLGEREARQLRSALLTFLATEYHRRDWVMLLHLGALRVTSSRLRALAGAAGGYACIGRSGDVGSLCRFLDRLEGDGVLPRTVLFALNPADTDMYASVAGSFVEDGRPGKVQFGPAWWYNDHRDGILRQLRASASLGLLRRHIGMTTDSRSLLSCSRHEYFRRLFCNLLGKWVEAGELPDDADLLSGIVRDVCYGNAHAWLALPKGSLP